MNRSELRWSMAAGIAFVVCMVAGVLVSFGNYPDINSSDTDPEVAGKFVDTLSDSGNRTALMIGAYLLVVAAVTFVWFCQGLRAQLTSVPAGRLVTGLGVLAASALAAGGMTAGVGAGSVSLGDEPVPQDGGAIRIVMNLTYMFVLIAFALAAAAVIATFSLAGRRAGLPRWLVYSGWVAVAGGLFGVVLVPLALPALWFLAAAIFGLTRPEPPRVGVPAPRAREERVEPRVVGPTAGREPGAPGGTSG